MRILASSWGTPSPSLFPRLSEDDDPKREDRVRQTREMVFVSGPNPKLSIAYCLGTRRCNLLSQCLVILPKRDVACSNAPFTSTYRLIPAPTAKGWKRYYGIHFIDVYHGRAPPPVTTLSPTTVALSILHSRTSTTSDSVLPSDTGSFFMHQSGHI